MGNVMGALSGDHGARRLIAALALPLFLGGAGPAFGTLIATQTSSSIGLVDVGRDNVGGLDWLNLKYTLGLSYQQVSSGPVTSVSTFAGPYTNDWIADGWRYATTADLCNLIGLYVPGVSSCPGNTTFPPSLSGAFTPLIPLRNLGAFCLGVGFMSIQVCGASGMFDDGGGSLVGLAQWTSQEPVGFDLGSLSVQINAIGDTQVSPFSVLIFPFAGSYLVRAVPEPSIAALLGTGLLGIGAARRSRR